MRDSMRQRSVASTKNDRLTQFRDEALCSTFREDLRIVPWLRSVPETYLLTAGIPSSVCLRIA